MQNNIIQCLREIHGTPLEAHKNDRWATSQELTMQLLRKYRRHVMRVELYRLMKKLEEKGLIIIHSTPAYTKYRERIAETEVNKLICKAPNNSPKS